MTLRSHLGPRTPENAALHDELDKLLAAPAAALAEAGERMDNGHSYIAGNAIRALITTSSTEALRRVIRAHVDMALEMAREVLPLKWSVQHDGTQAADNGFGGVYLVDREGGLIFPNGFANKWENASAAKEAAQATHAAHILEAHPVVTVKMVLERLGY